MKDFESALQPVDVLSLDIFDTALGRRYALPVDVFVAIRGHLVASRGQTFARFVEARQEAENVARGFAWNRRQAEDTHLAEIYEALLIAHPEWTPWADELPALEMAYERRALYPLPFAQQAIARARALGKRVIFVSDMYLPKAFCEEMLRSNGFDDFDALYVSSDCGLLKNTGSLYRHVLAELQLPGERILHVGDNPHADGKRATEHGLHTYALKKAIDLLERFPQNPWKPLRQKPGREPRESLFLGLSARGCLREDFVADPFWYRIGYQIAGPLIYGYVRFIIGQTRGRGLAKIFFLSRDGYILRRVYERLTADQPDCPPAGYLYASRRALNFAALTELNESMENWLAEGIGLSVGQFLQRIGLDPNAHLEAIGEVGFKGPNQRVVEGADYTALRLLYRKILPTLQSAAATERAAYLAHLRAEGALSADPLVIVDVGWMTSIQHSLTRMIRQAGRDPQIEGYYIGTYHEAAQRRDERSTHRNYLLDYGQPNHAFATIRHCVCLLEFFFAAPEHTFLRMEEKADGTLRPEFAPLHENQEDLPALRLLHEGIEEYAAQMAASAPFPGPEVRPHEALALLHRLLAQPTKEEAERLGEIRYADGYGAFFFHTRMARPSGFRRLGLSKSKWKKEFRLTHWPKGYYTRLGRVEKWLLRRFCPKMDFVKIIQ
jgi:predicted HAD superfamily hydrolase